MAGFFDRMLGRGRESGSAHQAKERLQFVLVHDRINLPPERLKEMKDEILAVISKYVDVDREEVDIALEQRDRHNNMLVAEIPFTKSRPMPPAEAVEAVKEETDETADVKEDSESDAAKDTEEKEEETKKPDEPQT